MNVTQDFVAGRWLNECTYTTPNLITYRHYVIIEDGLEYLVLECQNNMKMDSGVMSTVILSPFIEKGHNKKEVYDLFLF